MTATLELLAIREIAHAFLVADRPGDVYQFALDRVTPILGASFSLVMQLGHEGELLRPVAQHEWPARHRPWIGALRVRVGDGPSGMAVAEQRLVEVPDLFADPGLESWYAVAEELGFRSIIASPLVGVDGATGAVAFYFSDPAIITDEQRDLVRLVADQMAATADKAARIDALRRSNAALAEANEELEREARDSDASRRDRDRFLTALMTRLRHTLDATTDEESSDGLQPSSDVAHARATLRAAGVLVAIETGRLSTDVVDVDPRLPLLDALQFWRTRLKTVRLSLTEPTVLLPTMRNDHAWVTRLLSITLGQVLQAHDGRGTIHVDVEHGRGFVAHRVRWSGRPLPDLAVGITPLLAEVSSPPIHPDITAVDPALLVALAGRLGGSLQRDEPDGEDAVHSVTIVFPVEGASDGSTHGVPG